MLNCKTDKSILMLVYFDLISQEKVVDIDILDLVDFLEFIGLDQVIQVKVFLGIDYDKDRYYYQSDLPEKLSVKDFLSFINKNEIKGMDVIHLNVDDLNIEITDCADYCIKGKKIDIDYLQRVVSHFTGFFIPEKDIPAFNSSYLVIVKGKLIAMFKDFDEYVASEYSNLD